MMSCYSLTKNSSTNKVNMEVGPPLLKFECKFRTSYVRTRAKSIRCFPECCSSHMENSFCGRRLEITVNTKSESEVENGVLVFAEFRKSSEAPSFKIGQGCNREQVIGNDSFRVATFGEMKPEGSLFFISPNRKWNYEKKTNQYEYHIVSVYLVMNGKVLEMIDSSWFHVIPAWHTEKIRAKGQSFFSESEETTTTSSTTAKPLHVRTNELITAPDLNSPSSENPLAKRVKCVTPTKKPMELPEGSNKTPQQQQQLLPTPEQIAFKNFQRISELSFPLSPVENKELHQFTPRPLIQNQFFNPLPFVWSPKCLSSIYTAGSTGPVFHQPPPVALNGRFQQPRSFLAYLDSVNKNYQNA